MEMLTSPTIANGNELRYQQVNILRCKTDNYSESTVLPVIDFGMHKSSTDGSLMGAIIAQGISPVNS